MEQNTVGIQYGEVAFKVLDVSVSIASLPKDLTYCYCYGENTVTGEMVSLPESSKQKLSCDVSN